MEICQQTYNHKVSYFDHSDHLMMHTEIQFLQIPAEQVWVSPEVLCADIHLLHAEVSGRRSLTWAAGDRRHRQATEEEVHGGQEGLQKTDRAESRASMGGEVDFIGVRARWLEEWFILTCRPGGKAEKKRVKRSIEFRFSFSHCSWRLFEHYQTMIQDAGRLCEGLKKDC